MIEIERNSSSLKRTTSLTIDLCLEEKELSSDSQLGNEKANSFFEFSFSQEASPFLAPELPLPSPRIGKLNVTKCVFSSPLNSGYFNFDVHECPDRLKFIQDHIRAYEIIKNHDLELKKKKRKTKEEKKALEPTQQTRKEMLLNRLEEVFGSLGTETPVNYRNLSKEFGMNRSSLRNKYLRWLNTGSIRRKNIIERTLTPEIQRFIEHLFEEGTPVSTCKYVHKVVCERFPSQASQISKDVIYSFMKKIGLSYKKVRPVPPISITPEMSQMRKFISEQVIDFLFSKYYFVYLDESSFDLNAMHINYAWGKRSKRLYVPKALRMPSYTLLCGMSMYGVEGWQIIKSSVRADDFWWYAHSLVEHIKAKTKKKIVLFMDNASIHRTERFEAFFQKEFTFLFNAPYSPDLNPIEMLFGDLKRTIREKSPNKEEEFTKLLDECLRKFDQKKCCRFVMHSYKFLLKGILNQPFNLNYKSPESLPGPKDFIIEL